MSSADEDNIKRRANEGEDGRMDQADCKVQENTTFELTPTMANTITQIVFKKLVAIPRRQLPAGIATNLTNTFKCGESMSMALRMALSHQGVAGAK